MHIPLHCPWLPGYIDVAQTILVILTMAALFPDKPHTYLKTQQKLCSFHLVKPHSGFDIQEMHGSVRLGMQFPPAVYRTDRAGLGHHLHRLYDDSLTFNFGP